MTKPRRIPTTRFQIFIVEPHPGFKPRNWQQVPRYYRIVEHAGTKYFQGSADAWKFNHNHAAVSSGDVTRWAIYVKQTSQDLRKGVFEDSMLPIASQ